MYKIQLFGEIFFIFEVGEFQAIKISEEDIDELKLSSFQSIKISTLAG
jgi:hypothetical protein|tara:strand:- start:92 stop:235 length:144 start_codon:yes stop_codon:yes gene_type:complete